MHYVLVPSDIQMIDPIKKKPLDQPPVKFAEFIIQTILGDPSWIQSGYEGLRSARKVEEAVAAVKDGVVALEDADWGRLQKVCEKPSNGMYGSYTSLGMMQLTPFLEAVIEAKDKAPVAPTPPVASAPALQAPPVEEISAPVAASA